jgi:GT2 family glycosyltransferase
MRALTIIIVSHNTKSDLEACLRSIVQQPPALDHEIVVVDNASRDGSPSVVRAGFPAVRLIELDRNVGFAAGNNVAFRQSASELVLLLNSDTVVPAGAVDRLVSALRDLPGASIVGPRLVDASGTTELSFGKMMSPVAELQQKLIARQGSRAISARASRLAEVDWVSGACLLVRRADAEAAGLLDERYFMYCEDVDFCAAVRANGGKVYFVPEATVIHHRGRSAQASSSSSQAAFRRSQLAFYRKHHPHWEPVLRLYLALQGKLPPRNADKT